MTKPNKIQTVKDARQYAESFIQQGVGMLAHALNACDDEQTPYRYGDVEQERLKNIVFELIEIVERGKVELLTGKRAKSDKAYQKFRHMVFNSYWYEDKEKFDKAAFYSVSPLYRNETLEDKLARYKKFN